MNESTDINYKALDPGIRETVRWLRAAGFNTTDSGDGVTKDLTLPGVLDVPHVMIQVEPEKMISKTQALVGELAERGVHIGAMSPDPSIPCIQATYDPGDESAVIQLFGVKDSDWLGK